MNNKNELFKVEIPKLQIPNYVSPIRSAIEDYTKGLNSSVAAITGVSSKISSVVQSNIDYVLHIQKVLKDSFNFNLEEILKKLDNIGLDKFLSNLKILGEHGWCLFNIDSLQICKFDVELIMEDIANQLSNSKLKKEDIDEYIGCIFTKSLLENIKESTLMCLDTEDKVKLKRAFMQYEAGAYLESCYLLASLIDAQSIKQEMFDNSVNKYDKVKFYNKKTNQFEASQGWRSFYRTFEHNFSIIFNGKSLSSNGKDSFILIDDLMQDVKNNSTYDLEVVCPIIHLAYSLNSFFKDIDWSDYKVVKPNVINRHWLMHGMYSIDDVTKYDCIKLALLLYQLVLLYKKVKNKEI